MNNFFEFDYVCEFEKNTKSNITVWRFRGVKQFPYIFKKSNFYLLILIIRSIYLFKFVYLIFRLSCWSLVRLDSFVALSQCLIDKFFWWLKYILLGNLILGFQVRFHIRFLASYIPRASRGRTLSLATLLNSDDKICPMVGY